MCKLSHEFSDFKFKAKNKMKPRTRLQKKSFGWDDYLEVYGGEPAPPTCFRQAFVQPRNDFKVGQKLVSVDPRNRLSWCIATVADKQGPYIMLRLDGTDKRNDFMRLIDSELIRPFDSKIKSEIQPPLAFRNDLSEWPAFYNNILKTAHYDTFAPVACFKTAPPKPAKNQFKIGHKLEALDTLNPNLLCPATVVSIHNDLIEVAFDGWDKSWNFSCDYGSRDIFPVGWCKRAGYMLQPPGYNYSKVVGQGNLISKPSTSTTTANGTLNEQQIARTTLKKVRSKAVPVSRANTTLVNNTPQTGNTIKLKRPSPSNEESIQSKHVKCADPFLWDANELAEYILKVDASLAIFVNIFIHHGIDGKALANLTADFMVKTLDIRAGPALRLSQIIERLKRRCISID